MSPVGTTSLVTTIRDNLFSASFFSSWQPFQIGPIWLTTCSPVSANGAQRHPRALGSDPPQGENSSVTDTLSRQSLSAPGGMHVRFSFTLSGITQPFLTQPSMRMCFSYLISTGASQTIKYLPQHFLFLMSLILSN